MSAFTASCRNLAAGTLALVCSLSASATPVTYSAWTVADITLGANHYKHAEIHFSLTGDTNDLSAFDTGVVPDGQEGCGWQIQKGIVSVRIVAGTKTITAHLRPGQVSVAHDSCNLGAGFVGYFPDGLQPGYPLVIDGGSVPYSNGGGVALGQPGFQAAPNYLGSNLTWSGHAWSCINFPPEQLWYDAYTTGASTAGLGKCGDPSAYPLHTDKGDLIVYQNLYYMPSEFNGAVPAGEVLYDDYGGSLNDGFFAAALGAPAAGGE